MTFRKRKEKMSASRKNRGFTLVELIVVLVILAILAAILVPALLGYIDKAKKEKILLEAKDVWTASQAALAECYGLYPDSFEASCKFTSTIDGKTIKKLGRMVALNFAKNGYMVTMIAGKTPEIVYDGKCLPSR